MKIRQIALTAAVIGATLQGAAAQTRDSGNWVGSWGFAPIPQPPGALPTVNANPLLSPLGAPPAPPPVAVAGPLLLDNPGNVPVVTALAPDLVNATLRQLVRVSLGGKRLRLRFSNEGGNDFLVLDDVHVGIAGPDGTVVAGSDHTVSFDGHQGVAIPAGAPVLSDAVDLPTNALDKLAISIHVPGPMPRGGHGVFQYVSGPSGDHTAEARLANVFLIRQQALVTEVDVDAAPGSGAVVALGDSITDGAASTSNAFRSWPDRVAERLAADKAGSKWGMVNVGIGGNRLLRYGTGPSALARLDRDVLSVPGLKAIILLEGINDIGRSFQSTGPTEPVTAEALEAADKQIIARAHEKGVKVIGALLTPYKGATYESDAGEATRTALNNWIKNSGAFDGVVDFATPIADPADPLSFAKSFNDRDHLHPNDAGYQAMANAFDLKLLTGK